MNSEAGGAGGIPQRIKHNLTFPPVWFPHRQRAQFLPAGMCSDMALKDRCADMPVSCYVERLAGSKGQGYYTARAPRVAAVEASWNVMAHAQKPDLAFLRNGWVHLNRLGASVQSTTGSRGVRISGSNAGYTMFCGSVKSTGYPLHSPVSTSLPLPCVNVCHRISTGAYPVSSSCVASRRLDLRFVSANFCSGILVKLTRLIKMKAHK